MIPIASPIIEDDEIEEVVKVLKTGFIAQGPKVEEFEEKFAEYVDADYAIAVNSGTAALHVALLSAGIGEGDEVITTPFTFAATGNSVLYTGAKPVFVDIEDKSYNIDPEKIQDKITKNTKAILPVHIYGQCADMDHINEIASENDLIVIEDAAQAHGAKYNGKSAGSLGDMACFSFYPTKNMTTSEGGIITTNNKEFADNAKLFRAHGEKIRYNHSVLGYNFRMTDISAAIGLTQLKKVDGFNNKRIANAEFLSKELENVSGIRTPKTVKGRKHVFHQYSLVVEDGNRDDWIKFLNENDIGTGIHYPIPLYNQELYKNLGFNDNCPVTEEIAKSVFSIPVHPKLSKDDLKEVVRVIKEASDNIS